MATPRRSRRPRTTLLLLVLASVTIITLDARGGLHRITSGVKSVATDAFAPVRSGVDGIVEPVGQLPGRLRPLRGGATAEPEVPARDRPAAERQAAQQAARPAAEELLSRCSTCPSSAICRRCRPRSPTSEPATSPPPSTSTSAATEGVQLDMPVVGGRRPGRPGGRGQPSHGHRAADHRRAVRRSACSYGPAARPLAVVNGQGSGKPLTADLIPTNRPAPRARSSPPVGCRAPVPRRHPRGPSAEVPSTVDRRPRSR